MKNVLVVILSALIFSCSKSSSSNNQSYYFKFKLDNVDYSAVEYAASNASNNLSITALGTNFSSSISNGLTNNGNFNGIGNYLLNNDQYQLMFNLNGLNLYMATDGQLNITKSESNEIEGNFNCTLTNLIDTTIKKQITAGSFHLPIQ